MQTVTYPKRGAKVLGYRFMHADRPDEDYYHATIEIRRFTVGDYAKETADAVRRGQNVKYCAKKAQDVKDAGSPDALYLSSSFSSEPVTIRWQANLRDYKDNPEPDPTWYGAHVELYLSRDCAAIVRKIAEYCAKAGIQPLYVSPADVIAALRPIVSTRYVDNSCGDWIIDPDPEFAPRQLTHVQAEAPAETVAA